ncbi:MAG: DUF4058 family protein [Gemmataceae bacterium]|nr:DUF4058 family protein [Gemmataceae bacterium]
MLMHDWRRVKTYVYHDFHAVFIPALRHVLNDGVLPAGYYAMAEQVTRTMGPDVLTLEVAPGSTPVPPGNPAAARLAVADAPPRVRTTGELALRTRHQHRLAIRQAGDIRHSSDDRLVALVELVSPGNKSARQPLQSFVKKALGAFKNGIHLLVIDPFPPGRRDPNGIHGAIWDELGGDPYTQPADAALTLASYEADADVVRCYVEPFAVGQMVPAMPLFLEPGKYVLAPLDRAYQAAFAEVLPQHRAILDAPATSDSSGA